MKAKKKAAPRTQEQRRHDTRTRVLNAAIDILADRGYAHFTTTAVAIRAGVSRGAQENYFPTRTDLIAAATAHAMDEAIREAKLAAERAGGVEDALSAFLEHNAAFFVSRTYLAMIELALAGRDSRPLQRIHRAAFIRFRKMHDEIWIDALAGAGYDRARARQFVELTIYVLRGTSLTKLILPQAIPSRVLLERWRIMAADLLGPSGSRKSRPNK
ncbi:MAG: TetR/AcrR family transcriptional regulator [Xanthobacteraceae bacterium]